MIWDRERKQDDPDPMKKKFLINLAILVFLNLLIKPFFIFGIDRTVQNTVGLEDYGFYFSILNFAFLFYILLDAGVTNFNNRNIAQHAHLLNKHFSSLVIMRFVLAAVYVAVTFLVAFLIGYDADQMKLLAWVGFNHFLLSFILYLRSNVNGLMLFKTDSLLSVLDRVLMILICGVLLWTNITGGTFRIEWFVYAQTASYAVTALIAMLIVINKAKFRKLSWNSAFFLVILKKSMPFAVLALLMAIYNRLDAVLIERLIEGSEGERQAGIYANAFRLLDALNQIAWLFAILLLPIYARMIKVKEDVSAMVRLPFSLLFTVALIAAIGSLFYRTEIMGWLYPRGAAESPAEFAAKLAESSSVYGILMFCFLGTTTMYIFSTLLTANGSLKQLNLVALGGIAINFTMNLVLVPRLSATGAAFSSLATQILTAGTHVLLAMHYFRLTIKYRFILSVVIFAALIVLVNMVSVRLPYSWQVNFILMTLAGILLAFALRLVNVMEIIRVLREKSV
jgi:O-antigen/teichoic acid export membrane protein